MSSQGLWLATFPKAASNRSLSSSQPRARAVSLNRVSCAEPPGFAFSTMTRCRLYIDEVGNDHIALPFENDNERYLSLTGIITRIEFHSSRFCPLLDEIKTSIFGPAGKNLVFHRREILRREHPFEILRDDETRNKFDARMLDAFRTLPYLASTVAIDKKMHWELYGEWLRDPYHYCLTALVERYVLWMRRNSYDGDVAIEPRNPKSDRRVKEAFQAIYGKGTEHIKADIVQRHLTSKEIKFIDKKDNCPAMQITDLIAHPSARAMKFARLNMQLPDDYGARVVEILEKWKYTRHPTTKVRDGWGKKWLPK